MKFKKPLLMGIVGSLGLIIVYFAVLSVLNSPSHAFEQFIEMWYLILALVIGFGIQVGLYTYIKVMEKATKVSAAGVVSSCGISGTSMVACCLHHATDVLPLIGFSAVTLFLLKYQVPFMLLGIFSNLVGIAMMFVVIQRHGFFDKKSILSNLMSYDMKAFRNFIVIVAVIFLSLSFVSTSFGSLASSQNNSLQNNDLINSGSSFAAKTSDENGVSIETKLLDFGYNDPVSLSIAINTHQGSLDFDMAEVSVLVDDKDNEYKALKWDGSPPGGHHRSGILTFPKLNNVSSYIKLIIRNVYDVPERSFIWMM